MHRWLAHWHADGVGAAPVEFVGRRVDGNRALFGEQLLLPFSSVQICLDEHRKAKLRDSQPSFKMDTGRRFDLQADGHTGRYIDKRNAGASQLGGLVPVMAAIPADLKSKAECEISSNCVSLKGTKGYGAVAKTLETLAGRAETISLEVAAGLTTRADILAELAASSARMETILANENVSIWKRRTDTGPKTAAGRVKCAEAKTVHGRETRAIRHERAEKLRELRHLEQMMHRMGMIG
jgi:hypothetical protein